jgi:sugar/nucleoside kinase (ribokinase family)
MRTVLVAGHICVDLMPRLSALPRSAPGELVQIGPLDIFPGGCVANTGGALAALGAPVQAVGDVGDDDLGALLVRLLATRGTNVDQVRPVPGRTTSYTIVVQPAGRDRSFWHHVGANAGFDGAGLHLSGADLLHVGYPSLLPALSASGGAPLVDLLGRARAAGLTTSLDLAVVDSSSAAGLDWPALLRRVLPHVDVLTPSVDDVRTTLYPDLGTGPAHLREAARRLVDLGAGVVMVTGGPAGAHLCTADQARLARAGAVFDGARAHRWALHDRPEAARPIEVRMTVGSGDAATAGLLYGLLADLDPGPSLELAMDTAARRTSGQPLRPFAG